MRRKVRFATEDGTMLRGYVHSPGADPGPGIVMCHGFGGVKPHIDHYAALFAEAGFAVLLYDHRGFGTSEGAPRQEVDPYRQLADLRDAITYAESQPEFDAERGFGASSRRFPTSVVTATLRSCTAVSNYARSADEPRWTVPRVWPAPRR